MKRTIQQWEFTIKRMKKYADVLTDEETEGL
jgi:hypothetical protein